MKSNKKAYPASKLNSGPPDGLLNRFPYDGITHIRFKGLRFLSLSLAAPLACFSIFHLSKL